ncbi:hypothetical protein H920_03482 [Fukomys damarensis]|uniref:Uncharacterized protein n=1 Tax=Fukomys damarensis TaxID=885580 RepID=A0A091DXU4_FUKDA|nr:hypothetical protein H920_03482 [Fukomys damarensis]
MELLRLQSPNIPPNFLPKPPSESESAMHPSLTNVLTGEEGILFSRLLLDKSREDVEEQRDLEHSPSVRCCWTYPTPPSSVGNPLSPWSCHVQRGLILPNIRFVLHTGVETALATLLLRVGLSILLRSGDISGSDKGEGMKCVHTDWLCLLSGTGLEKSELTGHCPLHRQGRPEPTEAAALPPYGPPGTSRATADPGSGVKIIAHCGPWAWAGSS